ncbi:MAG: hypothetical protein GX539_10495 [Candidatus Cloacimonetes bacterium]|nr:hypothetical protein [Candidatus Cloacimonadota bacterium]
MAGWPSCGETRARVRHRLAAPAILSLLSITLLSACSNKQRLGEYEFRQRTLAVATIAPPHPDVFSSLYLDIDASEPVRTVLSVGSGIARNVAVEGARARVDSAARAVDISERMGARILDRASRHLRATPTTDNRNADYEIEVRITRYGLTASSWTSQAYFTIDADLWLLDGATGRRIWKSAVHATDQVSPVVFGPDAHAVGGVVTAISIANMSAAEMQKVFEGLADFAADWLVNRLAHALDDARG